MFLSTALLGRYPNKDFTVNWELSNDEYGNTFIKNDSIRQKIRLGKSVEPAFGEIDVDPTNLDIPQSIYTCNTNTFVSNNYKNMHLVLMNFNSKSKTARENHLDDNLAYIAVNNADYHVVDYSFDLDNGVEIVQTFHKSKKITTKKGTEKKVSDFQGLSLRYKMEPNIDYLILGWIIVCPAFVKKGETPVFDQLVVKVSSHGELFFESTGEKDIQEDLLDTYRKNWFKNRRFNTMYADNTAVTNTYIVNPDNVDWLKNILPIKNPVIIPATEDDLKDDNEELIEKIDNNRIRAITFVGFDTVPQGFYRKHKILYAYYMEPIEGTDGFWIENIKSN